MIAMNKCGFEDFYVSANNKQAFLAANAVARHPGEELNPLYIYGKSQTGKTLLLHMIENYVHENDKEKNVVRITSEMFRNEVVDAIRKGGELDEFRKKYRGANLFLIDDIDFLFCKAATLDEFLFIFNDLYEKGKQIVMTGRYSVEELKLREDIPEKLLSRLEWGKVVGIPDNTYEYKKGCEDVVSIGEAASKQLKLMRQIMDNPSYAQGLKTGFKELDSIINGFRKGELIAVCGRPSIGKTAFALSVARNNYMSDIKRMVFFSLEMSSGQVANRILAMETTPGFRICCGAVKEDEWDNLNSNIDKMKGCNFLIDDKPGISTEEIKERLIELKKEGEIDLVIIDYLQLMPCEEPDLRSRQQEIGIVTKRLKRLAYELDIPIMVISQLSKIVEMRKDHRPILSDLREASMMELFADSVIFLYRDGYYNEESEDPNITEVIVAKHKDGACGTAHLKWNPHNIRFEDPEE